MKPFFRWSAGLLAVVGLAGCAELNIAPQDYVKKQDEAMNSRIALVEASIAQEKKRLDLVAAQVTQTRAVADSGLQKAGAVDARLTSALNERYKRVLVDRVILFFDPGKSKLLPVHEDLLNGVLKVLAANPTYTADIVGFTDTAGSGKANLNLSWQREESARRYLAINGREINRFSFIGLGEDAAMNDKNHPMMSAADRRLTVLIYRPVQ